MRWILGLGLLALALHNLPPVSLRGIFHEGRVGWIGASIACYLVGIVLLEALRFISIARMMDEPRLSMARWISIFFESRAFLYVLPSGMGQEGFLWYRLREAGWRHGSCVMLVGLVRASGLALWCGVLALALMTSGFRIASGGILLGITGAAWVWMLAALVLSGGCLVAPWWFKRRWPELQGFRPTLGGWGLALGSTLLMGWIYVFSFQAALRAYHLSMDSVLASGTISVLFLAMVLPVSVAGVGIQEVVLLRMGAALGWAPMPVLGLSLVLHLQRLVLALAGLVLFLLKRHLQHGPFPSRPRE